MKKLCHLLNVAAHTVSLLSLKDSDIRETKLIQAQFSKLPTYFQSKLRSPVANITIHYLKKRLSDQTYFYESYTAPYLNRKKPKRLLAPTRKMMF